MSEPATVRKLWQVLEPYHAIVYFAPEARKLYESIGLKGFWMGYFASRAYPLGPAPPELVTAVFFGFHPQMVARALPDAWALASVPAIASARLAAADAALRRVLGDAVDSPDVTHAASIAEVAARACPPEGRPLYAAYSALPWPDAQHLRLWHAATLLREHRGDGHIVANLAHGIDGIQAHVLMAATARVPRETLQPNRGWSDEDWDNAQRQLADRGWIDDGRPTAAGHHARRAVEELTDDLATAPWRCVAPSETERLHSTLESLSQRIVDGGAVPVPNPMGLPWPPT